MEELNDEYEPSSSKGIKFEDNEKLLLLSYIEDLANIIEDTSTTSKSLKKKNNAWSVITEQFAANSNAYGIKTKRKEGQLKNRWRNLKHRCRQADSAQKQARLQTGSGPPLPDDPDEQFFEKVRIIAPTINFTLENPWDNTGEFEADTQEVTENGQDDTNEESFDENPGRNVNGISAENSLI